MSFASGFRGTANGSVQSAYTDQPGVAVAGMLAFAGDLNNIDSLMVDETNGIAAGKGVVAVQQAAVATNLQRPNQAISLPSGYMTYADFAGVVVFEQAMQTDENGNPGWADNRQARVLRPGRAGGRIYVDAKDTITTTDGVHWVILAPEDGSYALGDFSPTALSGGAAGHTVLLPNVRWVTPGVNGDKVIIELLGDVIAGGFVDDSNS